jgi:hypothetical protein
MQYNLAINSQIESDTQIGNVALSTAQILPIIQTTLADDVTLSGTDILCLDCDLGARVKINEIRYYFSSSSVSGTVADSIDFYYKNEDFDIYLSIETLVDSSSYYTTITSGTSSPRYLRIVHTVSGTSISGTINGFQVANNEDIVDFGTYGTDTHENFEMAFGSVDEEVRPVYIYNDGEVLADAYVSLESQKTVIDEILSISVNQDGPWYNTTQEDNVISGEDVWDTGNYVDTMQVFEQLELSTGSGIGVGTYTTRIFDTMDTNRFTYLNLNTTYTGTGMIVATNYDDTQQTIEIRSSNQQPLDYIIYRKFIPYENDVEGDIPIKYREHCMYDESVLFTSPNLTSCLWSAVWSSYWDGDSGGRFYMDKTNKKSAAMFAYFGDSGSKVGLVRINATGDCETSKYDFISGSVVLNIYIYSLLMDINEGIWLYVYFPGVNGWFDQNNSYYLAYFDKNMTEKFKLVNDSGFVYDMDHVYTNGDLWYTDPENDQAVKIDNEGNVLVAYQFVDQLKGIVATTDGGCWVIQGKKIFNISSDGLLIDEIDLTSIAIDLTRIAWDGDDAFWVIDETYIRRILLNGQVNFSIELPYQPAELQPYDAGVAVFCIDRSWRFVSKDHKRVIKTIENDDGKNMYIGVEGAIYSNLEYANKFPISFDTYWSNLEWNTVAADYYLVPEDKYNQIRLTLRANEALESPIVKGLYLNESIQVQNIYSKNYKTMYMKADISGQDESDIGSYDSNLKVWWYIPV